MTLRDALLEQNRQQNPLTYVQDNSKHYFKLDSDLFQALWFLDYNIVHENGLYFLTNSFNKMEVLHLSPVNLSGYDGEYVELEFVLTMK